MQIDLHQPSMVAQSPGERRSGGAFDDSGGARPDFDALAGSEG
jgi:hypothetical protein